MGGAVVGIGVGNAVNLLQGALFATVGLDVVGEGEVRVGTVEGQTEDESVVLDALQAGRIQSKHFAEKISEGHAEGPVGVAEVGGGLYTRGCQRRRGIGVVAARESDFIFLAGGEGENHGCDGSE